MKKKTILNSTFAVLILVLSACGDKGDRAIDDQDVSAVESEIITITSE